MPRPKGSKNLLNAKALKAELEKIKNVSAKPVKNVSAKLGDSVPLVQNDDPAVPEKSTAGHDLKIKVPRRVKTVKDLTHTFGCGNRLCDYESDDRFSVCPKCGVTNNWRSE
jgi:hypothetical protein